MDLKQLLGKLDLIEGSMNKAAQQSTGPKFTGQWRGTDKETPGRKLVGDSVGYEENILKDLSRGPTPKTKEQDLAEQFEQFLQALEEENLGVNDKRPLRQGSRPAREYGKTGEHSKRYTYNSEDTDESRGHKIVATKLKDIDRANKPAAEVDLKAREAQAKAEYRKYVDMMKKRNPNYIPLYKMDEAGANNPPQQQGTTTSTTTTANPQQQQQAKNVAQGTQALKAAVGSSAPTDVLAKAIDSASKGTAIDAPSAKALEPMMDVIKQAAQDPNLANQFKSLASQAKTSATKQQNQQQKPQEPTV